MPSNSYSITSTFQNIVGTNYASYLNQGIYFSYTVGNCGAGASGSVGSYTFHPGPLIATTPITVAPTCKGGTDGSLSVSLSRPLISGETITLSLHTSNALDPTTQTPKTVPVYAANATTINNVGSGTYYAFIESNYGNCGVAALTQVIVGAGPRNALSRLGNNFISLQWSSNKLRGEQVTAS